MKATTTALLGLAGIAHAGSQVPNPNPNPSNEQVWANLRGNIKYVVYLMMENHSFDNIAGYWDFNPAIDNLRNISFCNNYSNPNYTIYGEPLQICAQPYEDEVPLNDPDHAFAGTSYQIYEKWNPDTAVDKPTMGGFIERQSEKYQATPGNASFVINAYDQKKTQTLATLAEEFAMFNYYHSEFPGPTNPNRMFATSGTAHGWIDNSNQSGGWFANHSGVASTSIFEALGKKGISWKNYYEGDITDAFMYQWVQDNAMDKIVHATEFYNDIANGTLPTFSYINPECCTVDSMHPTSNFATGASMIRHLYNTLRNSKYWENTLLIINFDEAGGFADHVPPPTGVPAPDDGLTFSGMSEGHNVTFGFDRLGIRVPAFLISPWIPRNTLISHDGTSYAANSAYTHTSMLHFLQNLWQLDGLNNRVQWAKTFEHIFTLTSPRDDTLEDLPAPIWYGGSDTPMPKQYPLLNQPYSYYVQN